MNKDDVIINVDGLWKRYGLPLVPAIKGFVNRLKKNGRSVLKDNGPWALRDVSFQVKRGETLGIIGRNGAGKSTLLKILAGVTPPTRGRIGVRGRVFPMIELNAGIHPELTGRENVRLLGAIMGISRKDLELKIPEIEEFTELGEWFDQPVRKYSSGMLVRLGFGVAMNVDADVLLIDEVLAVGDIGFQNRCLERMKNYRDSNKTIIFVSHVLDMVQYLCGRVILLDNGGITLMDQPETTITHYENIQYSRDAKMHNRQRLRNGHIDGEKFSLLETKISDVADKEKYAINIKNGLEVSFKCKSSLTTDRLLFSFGILNQRREVCLWDVIDGKTLEKAQRGNFIIIVSIPPLNLSAGSYSINFAIRDSESFSTLAQYKGLSPFVVHAESRERGMLAVKIKWLLKK